MAHVQSGYQFAWKSFPQYVEDEPQGFIAILYGQIVAERTGKRLVLRDGGFTTKSTERAINGALHDGGVSGYRAVFVAGAPGEIRIQDSRRGESVLSGEMLISLE